jgi:hypothetical protein
LALGVGTFFFPIASHLFIVLIAKTIVELLFLFPVANFFNRIKLLRWFPIAQPFHVLYTVIAGWLGKFGSYQLIELNVSEIHFSELNKTFANLN